MAAVPSTSSASQTETEFDYEGVKKKYMRQIELFYFNKKLGTNAPWTRKVVEKIKSVIKEGIRLLEIGYRSQLGTNRIMEKYEIYTENGEQKLIFKRKTPDDHIIRIVGAEDCFDIVVDAHIKTDHGGYDKIIKTLRHMYCIPKTSIDFIVASCNVCLMNNSESRRKADNRTSQVFHDVGQVSLINMCLEPDHEFKFILFYLDRSTKFMLLRPLVTNTFNEVAMELLKIFLDIGPPQRLGTYDRVYFGKVLSLVRAAYGNFHNISLILPVKLPEISAIDVKNMLKKWQQQSGSRNWAMGCYMVQWENNCTNTSDDRSPYETVFKMKPWFSLQSSNKSLHKQDGSNNNASCQRNDRDSIKVLDEGDILVPSGDSEDDKFSNASEVAEITEENGKIITTIPLNPSNEIATSTLHTAKPKMPVNENQFSKTDVIIEQPLQIVGNANATPGSSVQPEITQDLDDIPASMIVKGLKIPENLKCHVCKTLIVKPYVCVKCNRFVHLFCSDRLMKQAVPVNVLNVTCTACTILAKRNEPKSKESDSDNAKKVPDDSETVSKKKKIA
ncbi:KRAB-A domain-containing protein 2-like [Choristoneura fumiferana]|uniref:KRAB-A domain-containing protein 2-like n=1 Tax=Choristoneura fumiferana TaxID=7141 RepID=UPI003D157766